VVGEQLHGAGLHGARVSHHHQHHLVHVRELVEVLELGGDLGPRAVEEPLGVAVEDLLLLECRRGKRLDLLGGSSR